MLDDFSDIVFPPVEYVATFDPNTGRVISVGPSVAFRDEVHKLVIDTETALSIIEGKILLSMCSVNLLEQILEVTQVRHIFRIDNLLHRVIDIKYSKFNNIDMYITNNGDEFVFELSENHGGTRKTDIPNKKQKQTLLWNGETVLNFFVTDYNDPNVLYQNIEFPLSDLSKHKVVVKKDRNLPKDFSVYTRRLFKNYVIETK